MSYDAHTQDFTHSVYEEVDELPEPIIFDTVIIQQVRSIPQSKIDNYKSQPAYNYDEDPAYEEGFFRRLWLRFKKWLKDSLGINTNNVVSKIIYYGLIFGSLSALLYYLMHSLGYTGVFSRSEKSHTHIAADLIDENTSMDTIEDLIAKAEQNKEFRLAIRLHYLKTLRILDDSKLIQWRLGKTNHDYLLEIADRSKNEAFENLNYIYEYSWYGQFEIENRDQYDQLKSSFTQYYKELS